MKKILLALTLFLCIGRTFASEKQPLPAKYITAFDAPLWAPGLLPPENPPVRFITAGWEVTIYSVFNESQLYDAFEFITVWNNDWYTMNMYLYNQFDGNYDITAAPVY